jgi:hypothetical protein
MDPSLALSNSATGPVVSEGHLHDRLYLLDAFPASAAAPPPKALHTLAKRGMLSDRKALERNAMPAQIGENHAKKMLKANELVLCMGVNQLRTPNIAMIAAACGFDAVYIDLEHNPTSLETAAGVCVAALGMGITPIARVTSHDPHDATRILDCGAQGVMVPHVQNAAEAKRSLKPVSMRQKAIARPLAAARSSVMRPSRRPRYARCSMNKPC